MNVIGHQAIGMHGAREVLRRFLQQCKIDEVIALLPEARHTVVATLNDMERHIGDDQAGLPGHECQNDPARARLTEIGA